MLIAKVKKESNIVEYILYMYQIEDIIRSFKFDLDAIDRAIVAKYDQPLEVKEEIKDWYADLIKEMKTQGVEVKGHLESLNEVVSGLQVLHKSLLTTFQDQEYKELYDQAKPAIQDLMHKSDGSLVGKEIAVTLNGLYGLLVLRLKKQPIAAGTEQAMGQISKMMAHLAHQYNQMKMGKLQFPEEQNN
jgi:flagellin-specific chaperone FliS